MDESEGLRSGGSSRRENWPKTTCLKTSSRSEENEEMKRREIFYERPESSLKAL